jgi:hypothetical protein
MTIKGGELTAMALMKQEFHPLRYAVYPLVPEGLTLLVGSPKIGKSWVALQLCVAVALGEHALGKLPVDKGTALYLALEDNPRRLQRRLGNLLDNDTNPDLDNLKLYTEWPSVDDGGDDSLDSWLENHPDTRLVVIDTLKMIKDKRSKGNANAYDIDYEAVRPLLRVAQKHGVALVVVHHTKKFQDTDDPYKDISGSTGLTGGVDNIVYLRRERSKSSGTLLYDGRDVEQPGELAIEWDSLTAGWKLVADSSEFHKLGPDRKLLYEAVRELGIATPAMIAVEVDKPVDTIKKTLRRMVDTGHLAQPSHGRYTVG